jgi:hypothetical protein
MSAMEKIGEAFGFFYYNGAKEDIENELPSALILALTPSELELSLIEGVENLPYHGTPSLKGIVTKAKNQNLNYVLKGSQLNAGNRRVADELGDLLNILHLSLYAKEEPFFAGIVYQRGKQFVFRRD